MPEKPTILVVDDDQPIVTLMRKLLVEFGFDAVTAMSGAEALAAARGGGPPPPPPSYFTTPPVIPWMKRSRKKL
jgi:CheY-like chemotaxis protein